MTPLQFDRSVRALGDARTPVAVDPAVTRRVHVVLALLAIYVLWGSTYLAIRVAVEAVPPLLAAGARFFIAGTALYSWARARGAPQPSRLEWRNLSILGALMFLAAYSGLFWAEKTLPSGIASVLVATIPIWTALLEIFVFRRRELRWALVIAIALGFAGVVTLALDPPERGDIRLLPCLAVVASAIAWSLGTIATTMMAVPQSKVLSAGAQMMTGGAMLLLSSAAIGELQPLPHLSAAAAAAIAYLIVAGSLVAFTAYQWLLTQMATITVTSYAYVNPVIALLIGYWLGGETLDMRTAVGSVLVLASTIALLTNQRR
jgi:drug/metabolite transporter (DMT)-like permease